MAWGGVAALRDRARVHLSPCCDPEVLVATRRFLKERLSSVQWDLHGHGSREALDVLQHPDAPVAWLWWALVDPEVHETEQRLAWQAMRRPRSETRPEVRVAVATASWDAARESVREDPTGILAYALRTALLYDPEGCYARSRRGTVLDEFLHPSLPVAVRRIATDTLIATEGWNALERVTMFTRDEGDREVLERAFKSLLSRERTLDGLSPSGFEMLTAQLLRKQHPELCVSVVGRRLDRGVDVLLYDGAPVAAGAWPAAVRHIVQCKRWRGEVALRETHPLLVAALDHGADAIFVTSSRFRDEHVAEGLRELPSLGHRVASEHPGVTIRVQAGWIREERRRHGGDAAMGEAPRDHVMLRLVDRDAIRQMMGDEMASGWDFDAD